MKKLAVFSVLGTVLAAGLLGQARAADVVLLQCDVVSGTSAIVAFVQASPGVTLPVECAVGKHCAHCAAALPSQAFQLDNSFSSVFGPTSALKDAFPFFVFTKP
jgi:hypothetical protein